MLDNTEKKREGSRGLSRDQHKQTDKQTDTCNFAASRTRKELKHLLFITISLLPNLNYMPETF